LRSEFGTDLTSLPDRPLRADQFARRRRSS
jgi:hypothetical protein